MRTPLRLAHSPFIHPFVEQRSDTQIDSVFVGGEFARLPIRFSGIRNVNDTPGSCATAEAAQLRFVEPLHRLLHFPRACDSLIKYSYIPL